MTLRLAKVTGIAPGGYSVDLLFLDDGSRVPSVQVVSPSAATDAGYNFLIAPDTGVDQWSATDSNTRDLTAVVGFMQGFPVVLGFLYPQVCQMLFDRQNFEVKRHPSDVYTAIDDDGNVEVFHPSGTYLRIGETPDHEDLTGQDIDGIWKISKNTEKAVHVNLTVKSAGTTKATVSIDPSGNISAMAAGNINLTAAGDIVLNAGGNVDINGTRIDLN